MGALTLRDYQTDIVAKVDATLARGCRSQLVVAATGLGKTVVFSSIAERMGMRTVVLVHRDELVEQAVAKMREVWPEATVGVVKGPRNDLRHRVVVASVQTLARQRRLAQLLEVADGTGLFHDGEPVGLLIVDEAHHATAPTYRRVIDAIRHQNPDVLLLGVTATPDRGDGQGLVAVFDEIVADYGILWGIGAGYLSDVRALAVRLDFDEADLTTSHGDYDQGTAGRVMDAAGATAHIVAAWNEHATGRSTIAFTPTVAMAHDLAARFVAEGTTAAAVDAHTDTDLRREHVRRFRAGELRVLTNCGVFTEGFDAPEVQCIVQARPTKSRALFTQMVGRGLRRYPGKSDCLVLDVVGASDHHSLVTVPSLFGVTKKARQRGMATGTATLSEVMAEQQAEEVRAGRLRAEAADLFTKVRAAGIAWVTIPDPRWPDVTRYVRSLGDRTAPTVVLARTGSDSSTWIAGVSHPNNTKQVLIDGVALETAQGVAEDYIRGHAPSHLVTTDAKWRARKPTAKAKAAAKKWSLAIDPAWNAGELSDALNAHIAKINAKKERRAKEPAS